MSEWMTAEEIKEVILPEIDDAFPQFEEDEYVLFWRFTEMKGEVLAVVLSDIPNPAHIHIRDKGFPFPPEIEVGFRLKEVKI